MRLEIAQLHKRLKATSVFVTHDQVEAMTMADRIVLLNDGVVQLVGTPKDLYDRPANLFVASLIGSPAMTLITLDRAAGSSGRSARGATVPGGVDARATTLGLRPEAVQTVAPAEGLWRGQVVGIEDLGFQAFVFCTLEDGSQICALMQGAGKVANGDAVGLRADLLLAHRFGADGARLF